LYIVLYVPDRYILFSKGLKSDHFYFNKAKRTKAITNYSKHKVLFDENITIRSVRLFEIDIVPNDTNLSAALHPFDELHRCLNTHRNRSLNKLHNIIKLHAMVNLHPVRILQELKLKS
jgi:hypothetical protein